MVLDEYQPMLRWAGSKKRQLPKMVASFPPDFKRYVEPFAGSACIFFKISPAKAILNDINPLLMDFYRTVVHDPGAVYKKCNRFRRQASTYYRLRKEFQAEADPVTRAAYFFYLNRNCFNGIFRVNRHGIFNVPFSSSRVPPYPSEEAFLRAAQQLSRAKLTCTDFAQLCADEVRAGDFVYLDPPYYVPQTRVFCEYTSHDFRRDDVDRLITTLKDISSRGAHFLLSYPKCEITRQLAGGWHTREISVVRSVGANTAARRKSQEMLIFNYGN